jgi:hypothetical protein
MPRTGSPNTAARSFFSTSCRLRFAAFRALACAMAYGSRCLRFCATVDALVGVDEVKERVEGVAVIGNQLIGAE